MSNTTLASNMRALLHNQKTHSLSIDTVPLPKPSPTQYLVKSHAVTLTTGELLWPRPEDLTISTPGCEFVATVVQSPSSTAKFQPGDKVYGRVQYPQPGGAREYTLSDDDELALRPKNLSINEAATMPMSALTAWQALFEQFKLTPPSTSTSNGDTLSGFQSNGAKQQRILITNASGGVGIWAVQLAKLANLHVTATTGTQNIDFVRSLGADEIIDYRTTNIQTWAEENPQARNVDFVFDCTGLSSLAQAWHAVKPGGQVLTIVPSADMQWKFDLETPEGVDESIKGRFFIMHMSGEQLGEITRLAEMGKVKAIVDSVYKLEEFEKAFDRLRGGKTRGKVVLRVDDDE
jgi:NADPH:quinone reductase-like Zn-dependent oxidoreductase